MTGKCCRCEFILIIFIWGLLWTHINAQEGEKVFFGTRPMAMGETFVALADDGNTIYWNPAGLPGLRRQEFTFSYGNLFGLDLKSSYAGYVYPIRDEWAIGVDWAFMGYDDQELGYAWNHINLGLGYAPFKSFALGINGNMVTQGISYDGTTFGKGSGFGMDFGLLWKPFNSLQLGLAGYNVVNVNITYENGRQENLGKTQYRIGAAWKPKDGISLAADLDERWHVGFEYWFPAGLAVRGGLQRNWQKTFGTEPLIYSVGAGLKYKSLRVDYAFENHPDLFPTHRLSLSFQFRPALINIKSAVINPNPVFRSLHRHYESSEFAEVSIKNSADADLPVKVSIFVPTMMKEPHEENLILPGNSTEDYSLGVTFSGDILTAAEAAFDHLVQPEIKVTYMQEKQEKFTVKKLAPTYVLGKGKISWDEPERIASFVTPESGKIDYLTRNRIQYFRESLDQLMNRSNLGKGIILFDALGELGLTYSPDLQTPFIQISKNRSAFDTVKYPSEMLESRVGDCDDLTVLYGSMLENVGIATMFLDVFAPGEGHIFLMFDSGLNLEEAGDFFLNAGEYVEYEGRIWIPVETTLVGQTFFTAWQQGATEYHRRKAEGLVNELDIRDAQNLYPPGLVAEDHNKISIPEGDHALLRADINQYGERIHGLVKRKLGLLYTAQDHYLAGTAYIDFGRLTDARFEFSRALHHDQNFSDAKNCLGITYIMENKLDEALFYLTDAVEENPNNAGFLLNVAITHFLQGKVDLAHSIYLEVLDMDLRYAGELDYLFSMDADSIINSFEGLAQQGRRPEAEELSSNRGDDLLPAPVKGKIFTAPEMSEARVIKTYRRTQAKSNNSVGLIFAQRENMFMAVEFFKKARLQDPSNIEYLVNLSLAHYSQGDYNEALELYKTFTRKSPELTTQFKFIESLGQERPVIKKFEKNYY